MKNLGFPFNGGASRLLNLLKMSSIGTCSEMPTSREYMERKNLLYVGADDDDDGDGDGDGVMVVMMMKEPSPRWCR